MQAGGYLQSNHRLPPVATEPCPSHCRARFPSSPPHLPWRHAARPLVVKRTPPRRSNCSPLFPLPISSPKFRIDAHPCFPALPSAVPKPSPSIRRIWRSPRQADAALFPAGSSSIFPPAESSRGSRSRRFRPRLLPHRPRSAAPIPVAAVHPSPSPTPASC